MTVKEGEVESDYLQATEVTQGQWKKVMVDNPSSWDLCGDDCPVRMLSWEDARNFTNKLNQLEKTKAYRLPSEAKWEYACRAGTTTEYSFGDDASSKLGDYAWYSMNSNKTTQRVAGKKPNSWGLYDMHVNVGDLVEDEWHRSYEGAPADGRTWVDNPRRSGGVVRGGSNCDDASDCRSAMRRRSGFSDGFRLSGEPRINDFRGWRRGPEHLEVTLN
jgi:formylglycine-generating enzyme required for sulfatase activity